MVSKTVMENMQEEELIDRKEKLIKYIDILPNKRIARNILYDMLGIIDSRERYPDYARAIQFA